MKCCHHKMIALELGCRTLYEQVYIGHGLLHPVAYLRVFTMRVLRAYLLHADGKTISLTQKG